jgi:catalase-peroxidase
VPPPQAFQFPLPDPPKELADMLAVEKELAKVMNVNGGEQFIRLALQSANTYRATDYLGGCNGARIRFSPGKDWKPNAGLDKSVALLAPIKKKFGNGLSYADLIVLAGNVAVKRAGAPSNLPFCPGRTDAIDGKGWEPLAYGNDDEPRSIDDLVERYERRGFSAKDFVSLTFATHPSPKALRELLTSDHKTKENSVLVEGLKYHPDLRMWAEYYATASDEKFALDFGVAWTKLMNSDRFDGPTGNVCYV